VYTTILSLGRLGEKNNGLFILPYAVGIIPGASTLEGEVGTWMVFIDLGNGLEDVVEGESECAGVEGESVTLLATGAFSLLLFPAFWVLLLLHVLLYSLRSYYLRASSLLL